jgi:hypothetical protein
VIAVAGIALSVPGCGGGAFTSSVQGAEDGGDEPIYAITPDSSAEDARMEASSEDGAGNSSDGGCPSVCAAPPSGHGTASCADAGACGVVCDAGYHACRGDCLPDSGAPSVDACVLTERFGVFVSPDGSDAHGSGTQVAPYATLGKAFDEAKASGKRVYACGSAGSYTTENLTIGPSRDGVDLYGGLNCSGNPWTYDATQIAKVVPATAGYALEVTGLTTGLGVHDCEFDALAAPATPAASGPAASSVAVFVSGSPLTLERVTVNAGGGQPGAAGTATSNWSGAAPAGHAPPNGTTGGMGGSNACLDMVTSSTGGAGGSLTGASPITFGAGSPGTAVPAVGSANGGAVGGGASCAGGSGASGAAASVGGAGAGSSGLLSSAGWTTGAGGGQGGNGNPGQGGGGGGGNSLAVTQVGSGGGAGGCGGGGGAGGGTGGSSFGILAYQAVLVLTDVTVAAGAGGVGGAGGAGQDGQAGAAGSSAGSCAGGTGGSGSPGAGGGGGAGGASIGVAWSGSAAPTIDGVAASAYTPDAGASRIAAGSAGAGGPGGSRGDAGVAAAPGAPGSAGPSGAVVQVP